MSRGALVAAAFAIMAWAAPAKADLGGPGCGVSTETGPEQVFQAEPSSRSLAAYSRDMLSVGAVDASQLDRIGSSDLHGSGFEETIRAFGGGIKPHAESDTFLTFWKDDPSNDVGAAADFGNLSINAANAAGVGGNGPGNVLIPLPSALVSGLSVMGGLSAMAGIRRFFKR